MQYQDESNTNIVSYQRPIDAEFHLEEENQPERWELESWPSEYSQVWHLSSEHTRAIHAHTFVVTHAGNLHSVQPQVQGSNLAILDLLRQTDC